MCLVRITDSIDEAVDEVFGFYGNYHSLRFVKGVLVLRMHRAPTPSEVAAIAADFADIIVHGDYEVIAATATEVADRRPRRSGAARVPVRPSELGTPAWLIDYLNGSLKLAGPDRTAQ